MPDARFLTFRTVGRLYALPAEQVAEVIRLPEVARVPQAPRGLLGLANLRGNVIPIASLRGLLGEADAVESATRAIVLEGAAAVALAVDAIDALVTVDTDKVETRQAELAALPSERLMGVFTAHGKEAVAKILDVRALIDAAFVQGGRVRGRRTQRAASAAKDVVDYTADRQMLVTFEVAGQEYAFPLDVVQEVLESPALLAALPATEDLVIGVTSFRQTLLPLLSLRGLLGFAAGTERAGRQKVVVALVGNALVGLLVDRMRSIFAAEPDQIEQVPPILAARTGGESKVSAIYRGAQGRRLVALLSPEQLFREDVMQRLKGSGGAAATPTAGAGQSRSEELQFVVFRLGSNEFGLPISAVSEVARVPDQVTRLPRTPKFLEGVVNLRGDVLPVVDQRRRFDMPPLAEHETRRLVVVRTERHRAGLIVDSVSEVLRCSAEDIAPAPNLTNEAVRLVHGVINLEQLGRIVLLLDPSELLTRTERGLLDAFQARTERVRA